MADPYSPRGLVRPLVRHARRHIKRLAGDADYAFFQKLAKQFGKWPRRKPGKFVYREWTVEFVDAPSLLAAWDEIFVNRIYDIGEAENPRLVDAGANIGLAGLYFRARHGRVRGVAFEPDPEVFAVLKRNLAAWGCDVEARQSALASGEGEAVFQGDGADAGRITGGADGGVRVRTEPLSPHLREATDLLKLDIEGAETEVLDECAGKLGAVARIFIEYHSMQGRPQRLGRMLQVLEDAGFRAFPRDIVNRTRGFNIPLLPPGEVVDHALNIHAVRESAKNR